MTAWRHCCRAGNIFAARNPYKRFPTPKQQICLGSGNSILFAIIPGNLRGLEILLFAVGAPIHNRIEEVEAAKVLILDAGVHTKDMHSPE